MAEETQQSTKEGQSRFAVPDGAVLSLLGSRDENLRLAEELLDADVHVRGNEITLSGDPADVADVVTGIEERGALATCDALLSGYQGSPAIADVVVDAVRRVKAANPAATYTCDPVMGNATSGCFVNPEIPPIIRERVVPVADVITPNQFELGFLTDTTPTTLDEVLASADLARAMGPSTILVTSVETGEDTVGLMAVDGDGAWLVQTPRLPMKANGSGDITAALFTAHLHDTRSPATALARTVSSVFAVLKTTLESGERELRLIEAQDAIASPACEFEVRRLR